jgi:hypothetical protein
VLYTNSCLFSLHFMYSISKSRIFSACVAASVSDPDSHGSALIWHSGIRIWIHTGNAYTDPDPWARIWPKLANKLILFSVFQNGFWTYIGMLYDMLPTHLVKYIFMSKSNFFWRQSLTRIRSGLASWIRIRIEVESWIWIRSGMQVQCSSGPPVLLPYCPLDFLICPASSSNPLISLPSPLALCPSRYSILYKQ